MRQPQHFTGSTESNDKLLDDLTGVTETENAVWTRFERKEEHYDHISEEDPPYTILVRIHRDQCN